MAPTDDEASRSDPAASSPELNDRMPLTMGLERFQQLLDEEGLYVEGAGVDDDDDSDYQDEEAEDDGDFFGK